MAVPFEKRLTRAVFSSAEDSTRPLIYTLFQLTKGEELNPRVKPTRAGLLTQMWHLLTRRNHVVSVESVSSSSFSSSSLFCLLLSVSFFFIILILAALSTSVLLCWPSQRLVPTETAFPFHFARFRPLGENSLLCLIGILSWTPTPSSSQTAVVQRTAPLPPSLPPLPPQPPAPPTQTLLTIYHSRCCHRVSK